MQRSTPAAQAAPSETPGAGSWASTPPSPASVSGSQSRSTPRPSESSTRSCTTAACVVPTWAERTGSRTGLRVVEVVDGSPANVSGLRAGDIILAVDVTPLGDAQSLQRQLFEEAIDSRMEITVLRSGALVDVVARPSELTD